MLDVDLQGVCNIKKMDLRPIYIFVQPPPLEVLEQRWRPQNTETEESLAKRLAAAQAGTEGSHEPGLVDLITVSDSMDKAHWTLKEALSEEIKKAKGLAVPEGANDCPPWTRTLHPAQWPGCLWQGWLCQPFSFCSPCPFLGIHDQSHSPMETGSAS